MKEHKVILINIEVAFALPDIQKIVALQVPLNTPVYEAIKLSKIWEYFHTDATNSTNHTLVLLRENCDTVYACSVDSDKNIVDKIPIGIFGKKIDPNTYILQDKDRIEIYRLLTKTPNQKRLERAKVK
jgi:putative ubiquitin-RnfH superfamily antitoxin RatB of RatAB toxin-antitoxin module